MLTFNQTRVVAYMTDGGIICPDCATKRIESEGVDPEAAENILARIDEGLSHDQELDLSPMISYTLGEHVSAESSDRYQVVEYSPPEAEGLDSVWFVLDHYDGDRLAGPFDSEYEGWDACYELAAQHCDDCHEEISE